MYSRLLFSFYFQLCLMCVCVFAKGTFGRYSAHTLSLFRECESLAKRVGEGEEEEEILFRKCHDIADEIDAKICFV